MHGNRDGRWPRCLLGSLTITALTAVMYSFGVFVDPVAASLDATVGAVSSVFAVNQFVMYASAGVVGFAADRRSAGSLLAAGTACAVLGLLGPTVLPTYLGLVVSFGLVLGIGFGTAYVAIYAAIARRFDARRGLAMSVLSVGFGLGALVGPPLADAGLRHLAWDVAYLVTAVPIGVLFAVAAVAFRGTPSVGGATADAAGGAGPRTGTGAVASERLSARAALSSRQFWLLSLGFLLSSYGFYALIVHFVPYASSVGLSGTAAAGALGAVGGASIPARFGAGFASDYVGRLPIVLASVLLMAGSLVGMIAVPEPGALVVLVLAFGVGFGGQNGLYSPLIADVFAVSNAGRMIGLTGVAFAVAGASGPVVSSLLYDLTGSYAVPFVVAGGLAAVGAVAIAGSHPGGPVR